MTINQTKHLLFNIFTLFTLAYILFYRSEIYTLRTVARTQHGISSERRKENERSKEGNSRRHFLFLRSVLALSVGDSSQCSLCELHLLYQQHRLCRFKKKKTYYQVSPNGRQIFCSRSFSGTAVISKTQAYKAQRSRRGFVPKEVLKLHGCGNLFTISNTKIMRHFRV